MVYLMIEILPDAKVSRLESRFDPTVLTFEVLSLTVAFLIDDENAEVLVAEIW